MDSAKPTGAERVRIAIEHKVQVMGINGDPCQNVVDFIMSQNKEAWMRGREFGWNGATKHLREKYGMMEPAVA